MQFSTSFAVINTALNLAAKKNSLQQYHKNGNVQSLQICCRAVNEAVQNRWRKYNDDNDQIKLDIVAALVAKLHHQNYPDKEYVEDWTVDNDNDYFYAVTVGLPFFNRTFLYDLVKNCDMSKQLCQVNGQF